MGNKDILVTGGLGFIGSHTVVELLLQQKPKDKARIVILDNLSNSCEEVVEHILKVVETEPGQGTESVSRNLIFEKGDLCDRPFVKKLFDHYDFGGVLHFAGLKAVNESVRFPLKYYKTNLISTLNLLEIMNEYKVYNLIFSSSATVYGDSPSPLTERCETGRGITNPYGETKSMIETFLGNLSLSAPDKWCLTALRYFNPIGAHPSGLLGENPRDTPNNLMPWILRASGSGAAESGAVSQSKLTIFGTDYETRDGTCIRDYVHVVDIAKAHIAAMQNWGNGVKAYRVYNLGTGNGTSVLELIQQFEKFTGTKVNRCSGARREGDLPECYCNPELIATELGWRAEKTIGDACVDAYRFYRNELLFRRL